MGQKEQLMDEARSAMEHSYSPYSHFRIGAAIRAEDGTIFTGTNIENTSYSLTIRGERVLYLMHFRKAIDHLLIWLLRLPQDCQLHPVVPADRYCMSLILK